MRTEKNPRRQTACPDKVFLVPDANSLKVAGTLDLGPSIGGISGATVAVRYEAVNAMLLNEFLKEHAKVEQLKKEFEPKIAEQQKQIAVLTAGLQKVSAQIELSKFATGRIRLGGPAPQVVNNNQ